MYVSTQGIGMYVCLYVCTLYVHINSFYIHFMYVCVCMYMHYAHNKICNNICMHAS